MPFKISRTGRLAAGQTVDLVTSDGTAVMGQNYQDASQTLTFLAGQTTILVAVSIVDDGTPGDGAKSVRLALQNPTGGALVGARSAATLWIVEDQ